MVYRVVILPQAEHDILTGFTYLFERAPEAAQRWYHLVRKEIESLGEMPERYPLIPESGRFKYELRQVVYGQRPSVYRIVYRISEEIHTVYILSIRHSARSSLRRKDLPT